MSDKRFKEFIKDMYTKSMSNTYEDSILGIEYIRNCFSGKVYFNNSHPMFSYIKTDKDMNYIIDNFEIDMLLLIPRKHCFDCEEIQIYNYDFKDYKIEDNIVYIILKNNKVEKFNLM